MRRRFIVSQPEILIPFVAPDMNSSQASQLPRLTITSCHGRATPFLFPEINLTVDQLEDVVVDVILAAGGITAELE